MPDFGDNLPAIAEKVLSRAAGIPRRVWALAYHGCVFRIVAPLLVLLALVLSGCDEGGSGDTSAPDTGEETSATATPEEEPSEEQASASTEPQPQTTHTTTKAFCHGIHPILTADTGEERGEAAMKLLSDGLPADMSARARAGLQVIVDLSPYFGDVEELFQSYYALGEQDKESVHAFAGYVTTECGRDLIKDLMPRLPKDLVAELPSELATLLPKR